MAEVDSIELVIVRADCWLLWRLSFLAHQIRISDILSSDTGNQSAKGSRIQKKSDFAPEKMFCVFRVCWVDVFVWISCLIAQFLEDSLI